MTQLVRYSRHILLSELGVDASSASRVRALAPWISGGLGNPVRIAAAGVGTLVLIDADRADLTNLQRQILLSTSAGRRWRRRRSGSLRSIPKCASKSSACA